MTIEAEPDLAVLNAAISGVAIFGTRKGESLLAVLAGAVCARADATTTDLSGPSRPSVGRLTDCIL